MNIDHDLLKALPVRFIEFDGGVILKRSCMEFHVNGQGVLEVLQFIIRNASEKGGISRNVLVEAFAGPSRAAISDIISQLEARNILVPLDSDMGQYSEQTHDEGESKQNIFYWNFAQSEKKVTTSLNSKKLVILGVNHISKQLASSLYLSGCHNLEIVDIPTLRNLDFFLDDQQFDENKWSQQIPPPINYDDARLDERDLDCLIATADTGGQHAMREWNRLAVERNFHFLPLVLQNLVGYMGPLVIPGETPCYECLRARQNSNMENPDEQRVAEASAFDDQAVVGFHPSMASMLADLAAVELGKFYGGWAPPSSIGKLVEVYMLTPSITSRKLLKVPRCTVCSPMKTQSSMVIQHDFYMPGNEES